MAIILPTTTSLKKYWNTPIQIVDVDNIHRFKMQTVQSQEYVKWSTEAEYIFVNYFYRTQTITPAKLNYLMTYDPRWRHLEQRLQTIKYSEPPKFKITEKIRELLREDV